MKRRKSATGIDHIGVVGRDLDNLALAFERLGFHVAPRCSLLKPDGAGGFQPMDQENHHVILGNGYIELTAMTKPSPRHHLAPLIARYAGLHIVALTTASADKSAAALKKKGIEVPQPGGAARDVGYPGISGTALFRWFKLPDSIAGEGLYCYVEHLTRELVVRPELATHKNGVRGLAHITMCVERPGTVVKRYEQIFDVLARKGKRGYWFDLAIGKLRVIDRGQLSELYPGVEPPYMPWLVGFTLRVSNLAATATYFKKQGIRAEDGGRQRLWIRPDDACGAALSFVRSSQGPTKSRTASA
ncbi:MAG: VOC family protein [Alphaproteobacteria bacterium]|nr:VOC family protein [Alphaproteobacteria bacterium]